MLQKYKIEIIVDAKYKKEDIKRLIEDLPGISVKTITKKPNRRTLSQNSAAHIYFSLVAEEAKEKGLTTGALFKAPADIPITEIIVKMFFKEVARLMFDVKSTSQLTTKQFGEVVDTCQKEFAERLDCTVPFPDRRFFDR